MIPNGLDYGVYPLTDPAEAVRRSEEPNWIGLSTKRHLPKGDPSLTSLPEPTGGPKTDIHWPS